MHRKTDWTEAYTPYREMRMWRRRALLSMALNLIASVILFVLTR